MRRILTFILTLVHAALAWAWGGYNILATELMEEGRYLDASKYWQKHISEVEDTIAATNREPLLIADMLRAISNEVNCLYMIDDYLTMADLVQKYELMASMYSDMFDEDLSEELLALHYKNKGALLYGQSEYDDAAFAEAEGVYIKALSHADVYDAQFMSNTYLDMAQMYYKWGCKLNSLEMFRLALESLDNADLDTPLNVSQKAITKARIGSLTDDDSKALRYFEEALTGIVKAINDEANSENMAEMLRKKGKILMLEQERLGIDRYSDARECYVQYVKLTKRRIKDDFAQMSPSQRRQAWMVLHQFMYDCCRLGPQASDLAYDMALFCKGYLLRPVSASVPTWCAIEKRLGAHEAAIEFVVLDGKLKALVITKGCNIPQMIEICDIRQTLDLRLGTIDVSLREALVSDDTFVKDYIYYDDRLPGIIWNADLMAALRGKKRVYFAPDAFLHQLAIEYMLPDDEVEALRLSSTAVLLQERAHGAGRLLLCGGIDYGSALSDTCFAVNDSEAYRYLEDKVTSIDFLPASLAEVESIYKIRGISDDVLLTGAEASETSLRRLAPAFNILHLSTHGYFTSQNPVFNDLKSPVDDNCLSHTGLILAGAQANIRSKGFDAGTQNDGILSAAEISESDWSDVDLVVLSACQTALGYQTEDGVYGLQRGMKMSGVGGMIVSLWSVDDYATSRLMKAFYEELQDSQQSMHTAFFKARKRLISEEASTAAVRFNTATLSRSSRRGIYAEEGQTPDTESSGKATGPWARPLYSYPFITIDLF